jgi:hypothetical protein
MAALPIWPIPIPAPIAASPDPIAAPIGAIAAFAAACKIITIILNILLRYLVLIIR